MQSPATGSKRNISEIEQKFIVFSLGDEEYGLPVLQVHEIVRLSELIKVPHSREYFMGLMDIRGRVLPVIDLKKKLGIHLEDDAQKLDRAIILETAGRRVGLSVDKVSHVVRFAAEEIDSGPPTVKTVSTRFITGVGKYKDRFVVLMNLEHLFSDEELAELFHQ
ncbi:MAG: purine-binding chemotaxis protein CheW [Leptospiraceae bacterium]|nr:purine-binding chemotaxis protein CheW [Leptospiraceae bacterium]MCB1304699.1 purine-binding chemotaxis protein CheW [Leptospiraceae bacterium]